MSLRDAVQVQESLAREAWKSQAPTAGCICVYGVAKEKPSVNDRSRAGQSLDKNYN